MCKSLAAAAAILGSMGAVASADPPSAPNADPTKLDPVAVESSRRNPRINEQVSEFVSSIARPATHESMARWSVHVCVFAAGIRPSESEFLRRRIGEVAGEAGIPVEAPGCRANFVVVVTSDPEGFLRDWWHEEHNLFTRERGVAPVERMIRTDRPVRVWHNACNAPPDLAREYRLSVQWHCNAPGALGSRLTRAAVRAIFTAIVVVDMRRIEGLPWGQVADYVAMVGLAQLRTDAETGAVPTILNLFKDGGEDRAKALTVWDQAFLKSVYASRDGSVTELAQIKLKMTEDLAR
jgi:hypothetical protein